MTMFKTGEQIEEMARVYCRENCIMVTEQVNLGFLHKPCPQTVNVYISGYTQAQQDIKEACSEGFDEWIAKQLKATRSESSGLTLMGLVEDFSEVWKAAKLSSKAQIDTLKQRELEYQGDLRCKDRIINEKSNQIIEITKELQEKDKEIEELKEKFKAERNDVFYMDKRVLEEKEKYQEAVKDIKWMSEKMLVQFDCFLPANRERVQEIRTKYGLDKEDN